MADRMVLTGARVVLPTGIVENGRVIVEGARITGAAVNPGLETSRSGVPIAGAKRTCCAVDLMAQPSAWHPLVASKCAWAFSSTAPRVWKSTTSRTGRLPPPIAIMTIEPAETKRDNQARAMEGM